MKNGATLTLEQMKKAFRKAQEIDDSAIISVPMPVKITVYKNKRYLRVREVAKLFNVHPDTVRRWDKYKWLEAVRTPGGTRLYGFEKVRKIVNDR